MAILLLIGGLAAAGWLYLLLGHGGDRLFDDRNDRDLSSTPAWPLRIVAAILARNAAGTAAKTVRSLCCASRSPGRSPTVSPLRQMAGGGGVFVGMQPLMVAGALLRSVRPSSTIVRRRPRPGHRSGDLGNDGSFVPADLAIVRALSCLGRGAAPDCARLRGVYDRFRLSAWARTCGLWMGRAQVEAAEQ
jgi:hypothetical protein